MLEKSFRQQGAAIMALYYNTEEGTDCPDHGPYADDDCPKC